MIPDSALCYRLSQVYGFPIALGTKFELDGVKYRFGAADVAALGLLAKIRAAWPLPPTAYWLLPFRDLVRRPQSGTMMAYAAQQTRDPALRCLAVWLRGRRGGKLGSATIAALYLGSDVSLRKEVVRALKRMHAWAALRRIETCEREPRIRRLARQKPARDYRSRMSQFMQQVTPHKVRSAPTAYYEREGLELDGGLAPRSRSLIREILDRIRRLVRGGDKDGHPASGSHLASLCAQACGPRKD